MRAAAGGWYHRTAERFGRRGIPLHKVTVNLPVPYSVLIERHGLVHVGALVKRYLSEHALAVVVTAHPIRQHWGADLERSLTAAGVPFRVLEMRDGERHKTLASLEELALGMVEAGADRDALVLALGGGVVGDVAAMLASIYMRGVSLVQVPTTLMAMIDSSLGGKTGVNLRLGKNLLGTYHHPRAIVVDPCVLSTLPEREFRSGLAEAVKYGIIRSRELFEFIEKRRHELLRREPASLEWLIAECLRHKAEVVVADEREADHRRILNFGHTLGHALESATDYKYFLHGEAVAWGMIAACRIAVQLRRLDSAEARRICDLILALCGPLPPIAIDPEALLAHAARDKKSRGGVLHFVLPREIGRVEITRNVASAVIVDALTETTSLRQSA